MKLVVQPDTDPAELAARTLEVIDEGNVTWERRRSAMPVIVAAAQIIERERPGEVQAQKMDDIVQLWSTATGREVVAYQPRRRQRPASPPTSTRSSPARARMARHASRRG